MQQKLGARRAAAFDLEAACSGFIYGIEVAQQFVMSRTYETVLVIGAEKLSTIVDWQDRNTCVLFGDGAGAASMVVVDLGAGTLQIAVVVEALKSAQEVLFASTQQVLKRPQQPF